MGGIGDVLGGAMSGASTGMAAGPWGALAGGVIGGAIGLFGGGDEQKAPADPYGDLIKANAVSGLNSHLGADQAANEAGQARHRANEMYSQMANDPSVAGNPAAANSMYNNAFRSAEDAGVNANIQGARLDQQTHDQALSQLAGQQSFDYNKYLTDQKNASKPSFFDSLAQLGLSSSLGGSEDKGQSGLGSAIKGIGSIFGGGQDGSTDTSYTHSDAFGQMLP